MFALGGASESGIQRPTTKGIPLERLRNERGLDDCVPEPRTLLMMIFTAAQPWRDRLIAAKHYLRPGFIPPGLPGSPNFNSC